MPRTRPGRVDQSPAMRDELGRRRALALRLGSALVAAVVLGLIVQVAFVPPDRVETATRSTFSYRADGFRGFHDVARRLGYLVRRHRRSYAQLPPPRETLLVALDPLAPAGLLETGAARIDAQQEEALRRWVHRGGSLLVTLPGRRRVAELGVEVRAGWAIRDPEPTLVEKVLGQVPPTAFVPAGGAVVGAGALDAATGRWPDPPAGAADLLGAYLSWEKPKEVVSGVRLGGEGALEIRCFEAAPGGWRTVAMLGGRPIVLEREAGAGRVWVCSSAYPFTNLGLGACATGPFAFTLLKAACGGREVWIDEYVHGLWRKRGVLGWALHTTLFYPVAGLLLLVALLAWRGAVRLGPPRVERDLPRRAKEEFVVALAEIARRAGRHRAAAGWILESYRARLATESGQRSDPTFDRFAAQVAQGRFDRPRLGRFCAELRRAYERVAQRATPEERSR